VSVVVLDFGSQYTQLIVRRLRELRAFSVLLPGTTSIERIRAAEPEAIVLSGSPHSLTGEGAPRPDPGVYTLGLPVLGLCYGFHLLVDHFGGRLSPTTTHEYGRASLHAEPDSALFRDVESSTDVWMSHADSVVALPAGWTVAATTEENAFAAAKSADGLFVGLQFHPEVSHTPSGLEILEQFLDLAGVERDWTSAEVLQSLASRVKAQVGSGRVLLGLSGGVDSSALALLLAQAGIDHLAVFVDHGLLRAGEREEVENALARLGVHLHTEVAADRFFERLRGVCDPEEKRLAIGAEFVKTFERVAEAQGPFQFLAQGTLYPDVIESAGGEHAANIKSHHNVGGLPEHLGFELVEPFRLLFKDEVRALAQLLALPDVIRLRHPFPGPGLAIRVLGEASPEQIDLARQADAIFIKELKRSGWYERVWQALAVLIPVRSVGVAGDERRYGTVVALRAVTSVDGMTADWARLPSDLLDRISARITREVPQIGRVVYDTTSKPPATIEWE